MFRYIRGTQKYAAYENLDGATQKRMFFVKPVDTAGTSMKWIM